ncbi:MAG: ribosome biogenesis GTPase YlqF [Zoogloeaceae bacterium]|jgi:ribosome biogenesis GTPase A|nr:ribosome biogenesis GTPase YlqF [Zoogloeaceae bacterium]
MSIQWFPGHMTAARRKIAETLARIDVVIEVLDARLPEASANPMIRALREFRQRPCLKILNKADLADPAVTQGWLDFYRQQPGVEAIALSCKTGKVGKNVAVIPKLCRQLAPHRNDPSKPLRMMIMGIPNVGKSTLMNALLRKRVAAVGDEPAVTKSQQQLDLGGGMTLTDTPGLLWPKIEIDADGYMLAASHAIGVNAMQPEEVAQFLADLLLQRYAPLLATRYGLAAEEARGMDAVRLLEKIGEKRGCRLKGGGLDHAKAALVLLADYRGGALGRVSLESPESRRILLASRKPEE